MKYICNASSKKFGHIQAVTSISTTRNKYNKKYDEINTSQN